MTRASCSSMAGIYRLARGPPRKRDIFIGSTGSMALGYAGGQLWRFSMPETERACGRWIAARALELRDTAPEIQALFTRQETLPPLIAENLNHAPQHILASDTPALYNGNDCGIISCPGPESIKALVTANV